MRSCSKRSPRIVGHRRRHADAIVLEAISSRRWAPSRHAAAGMRRQSGDRGHGMGPMRALVGTSSPFALSV
jgi:hypothetical protein